MTRAATAPRGRAGFTLIELLIVVVIIGILAAIAIPKFSAARDKAYRSAMMSDLRNLAFHQDIYHSANAFQYGTDLTALGAEISDGVDLVVNEATANGWAATAAHLGIPGEECGVFYGTATPANGGPATIEGVVACSF